MIVDDADKLEVLFRRQSVSLFENGFGESLITDTGVRSSWDTLATKSFRIFSSLLDRLCHGKTATHKKFTLFEGTQWVACVSRRDLKAISSTISLESKILLQSVVHGGLTGYLYQRPSFDIFSQGKEWRERPGSPG
jgi:hypothetical protein